MADICFTMIFDWSVGFLHCDAMAMASSRAMTPVRWASQRLVIAVELKVLAHCWS